MVGATVPLVFLLHALVTDAATETAKLLFYRHWGRG
jgi:hypothetical protein